MPGEPQTLAVPPPVSVQTLIWAIRNAVVNGGGSVNATGDGISVVGSTVTVDAPTLRTSLGLGSIATQSASAVAITGGTLAGITGLGVRDTSAAFDVTLGFTSAIPLDAARSLTVDVGNANRALTFYGDFVVPSGGGTAVLLGADNILTGANEVHNAAGFVARPSILQDGVALKGRAGGTFSYTAAITTAALTASRAFTIPAVSADDTFALLGIANAFTGANTFTNAAGIVTRAAATQDGVAIVGRAGGTSSYSATITTAALTGNRTLTIPAVTGNDTFALLGIAQTFTAANIFSVNGAASTPALSLTGTIFSGGSATTTKPLVLIEPTGTTSTGWSTNGTLFGLNAPTGSSLRIFDFQQNGTSKLYFEGDNLIMPIPSSNTGFRMGSTGNWSWAFLGAEGVGIRSDLYQGWASGINATDATTLDTRLYRGGVGILELRKSTTAQTFRVYGTFTDTSNYTRLALNTTSTTAVIACETAGTGADNIDLGLTPAGTGLVAFSNAASVDAAVVSTHTARVKFNGTEYKVLLATP